MDNKNELQTAPVNNEVAISYKSDYGDVSLTRSIVRKYFTKGNPNITDIEVDMYTELCKRQKLDPFVTGEVHLIKYDEKSPAQLVVGYRTYVRRAEENPEYISKEDGIIVQRGNEVIKKEGSCPYPGERLIGGWCRVTRMKGNTPTSVYKELAFSEYTKTTANWKDKPAFMISKVAIAQALRDAFPKDYTGIYTEEELDSNIPFSPKPVYPNAEIINIDTEAGEVIVPLPDRVITRDEGKVLYAKVKNIYGKEEGALKLRAMFDADKIETSSELMLSVYERYMKELDEIEKNQLAELTESKKDNDDNSKA